MPETDDPEVKWADGIDPALTFTADDVALLRRCAAAIYGHAYDSVALEGLAARIAALLPA